MRFFRAFPNHAYHNIFLFKVISIFGFVLSLSLSLSSGTEEATLQNDQRQSNMMSVASSTLLSSTFRLTLRHHGETGSGDVAKRRPPPRRAVVIPLLLSVKGNDNTVNDVS